MGEKKLYHVVSFSGGKDSTAMLLKMVEKGMQVDCILFCDTGLEFPEMYRHIAKVERDVGMPVTVVKADVAFEYLMLEGVKKRKADSKIVQKYGMDIRGYGWPGPKLRWCTKMLKDIPREKYLSRLRDEYEVIEYVGLAADEGYRMQRRQNRREFCRHPLVEWGMKEEDCLKYCYERGYDWGGLYRYFRRVSCWCCPLQSLDELRQLYKHFPALWRQLGEWDGRTWRKFRKDYSVRELEVRFDFEDERRKKGMPVSGRAFFFDFRKRLAEIGLAGTDGTSVGGREDGLSADSKENGMLVGGKETGVSAGGKEGEVFTNGKEKMGRIPMEYVKKKLSELKPYENNPRINDEAVDDVVESIRQCSYIAPIVIDEDGVILAGHTRYKALKKLGYQECEVVVVSALTDEQKKKYRLYDNKTAEMASWDQKKLSAELCDVDFCGYDFGQPETALPDDGAEKDSPRTMTCPCCGEVFEV